MSRKAAIVLALAGCLLGAQATDLPKPARALTFNKNKTTKASAKNTARSKTKVAQLCLSNINQNLTTFGNPDAYLFVANWDVFNCADVTTAGNPVSGAVSIGSFGMTCSAPYPEVAVCSSLLSLNTAWHKKTAISTLASSFWMDPTVYLSQAGLITMLSPLVTAANGVWNNKPEAINTIALTPVGTGNLNYQLTLTYKHKGWNPAAL